VGEQNLNVGVPLETEVVVIDEGHVVIVDHKEALHLHRHR
jgi:hypothetical protein